MKTNKYWHLGIVALMLSGLGSVGTVRAQSLDDILGDFTKIEPTSSAAQDVEFDSHYQAQNTDLAAYFYDLPNGIDAKSLQDLQIFASSEKFLPGNDKISTSLRTLMGQEKSLDSIGFEEKAFSLGVEAKQQYVYVTITSEYADQSKAIGSSLRGDFISQFENKTYALVPINELSALAEKDSVYSIEPQAKDYPFAFEKNVENKVISEGVQSIGVSRLHKANITGKGVKVGILDFGFARYNELQQKGEVPAYIAGKSFTEEGKLESSTVHGTACAEIVHDMAPDAKIYVAMTNGFTGQTIKAAIWLAEQGVDIISYSGGGHHGPHNGTSTMDKLVENITDKYGVLWVNAAGNEGQRHLPLKIEDKNNNQLVDISYQGKQYDYALVQLNGAGAVTMVWDDWGQDPSKPSSTQDLDMHLFAMDPNTKKLTRVASSENRQNGRAKPFEGMGFKQGVVPKGSVFYLMIAKKNASRPVSVHVHASGQVAMLPISPMGSIGIPATSKKALAVGAVDVRNTRLEAFSSQGPTDDGRMKPDVSAPDNNLTMAYGKHSKPGRFPGTSAACPHVSGFAALLHQNYNGPDQLKLRQLVEKNIRLLESNGPNNRYGRGYITAKAVKVGGKQSNRPAPDSSSPAPVNSREELQHLLDGMLVR